MPLLPDTYQQLVAQRPVTTTPATNPVVVAPNNIESGAAVVTTPEQAIRYGVMSVPKAIDYGMLARNGIVFGGNAYNNFDTIMQNSQLGPVQVQQPVVNQIPNSNIENAMIGPGLQVQPLPNAITYGSIQRQNGKTATPGTSTGTQQQGLRYGAGGSQTLSQQSGSDKQLPWRPEGYTYEEVVNDMARLGRTGYEYDMSIYGNQQQQARALQYGNPYPDQRQVAGYYWWNGRLYPIDLSQTKSYQKKSYGGGGSSNSNIVSSLQDWFVNGFTNWDIGY